MKRKRKMLKQLKTLVGRVYRDIERQLEKQSDAVKVAFKAILCGGWSQHPFVRKRSINNVYISRSKGAKIVSTYIIRWALMKEYTTRLSRPLIRGNGRDGRCLYDPEAKKELVRICLQPGLSVAKVALEFGINANLLRQWIGLRQEASASIRNSALALPNFALALALGAEQSTKPAINVTLSNGVKLELPSVALSDLPLLLNALAVLPGSASSRD